MEGGKADQNFMQQSKAGAISTAPARRPLGAHQDPTRKGRRNVNDLLNVVQNVGALGDPGRPKLAAGRADIV
jgi:hypothetical protein